MASGVGVGIGEGLGQAFTNIAQMINESTDKKAADREKQADALHQQAHDYAVNKMLPALQAKGYQFDPTNKQILDANGQPAQNVDPGVQSTVNEYLGIFDKYKQLFPDNQPNLIAQHFRKMTGRPLKQSTPNPRAEAITPGSVAGEAPAQKPISWQRDKDLPFKASGGIVYEHQIDPATGNERWIPAAGMSPNDLPGQLTPEEKDDAARVKAGLEPKATAPKPAKPLTFQYHPQTGGLTSITDPNSGETWDASNIKTAPQEVKARWDGIQDQQKAELKRKEDDEAKKAQAAEDRQNRTLDAHVELQNKAFQNSIAKKDYDDAKKVVTAADGDYQSALDRMATMDKNLQAGLHGDQQAMMSLVANHIGMTLSAQKGARINKAVWDEAVASAPWLETLRAKVGLDYTNETGESLGPKLLSGVKLTPEQMHQMVDLAHQKVDVLKDHKRRVEDEYHDALSAGKPAKAKGATDVSDDDIINALKKKP